MTITVPLDVLFAIAVLVGFAMGVGLEAMLVFSVQLWRAK